MKALLKYCLRSTAALLFRIDESANSLQTFLILSAIILVYNFQVTDSGNNG